MNNPIRILKITGSLASISVLALVQANAQLPQVGVEFLGRINNTTSTPGVAQSDVAGVIPMAGWNIIDNSFGDPTSPNVGESGALLDTNLNTTAVTITYNANDSWFNVVDPTTITTANAKLLNAIIKANGADGKTESFQFNHVPDGTYDLYVYTTMNGDGVEADVTDGDNITTYYIKEWHQFVDTNSFVRATNTNPNGVRDTGNYVKFTGLGTFGRGTIGATVTRRGTAGDGTGVPAIQLVPAGASQVNTTPLTFLVQPINRRGANGYSNVTFTAQVRGPAFFVQWYNNGTAVPGANSLSYTPAPITPAQAGTISVKVTNNLSSITSSNAILTVGQYVTNNGVGVLDGGILTITAQPQSVQEVINESGPVQFKVAATSPGFIGDASGITPPIFYQWQSAPKGSATFTDIAAATNTSYTVSGYTITDDGTQYRAVVQASDVTTNSSIAVLSVLPDTLPPVVLGAGAFPGSTQVGLHFNEGLDPVSATNTANYKVNGVAVISAVIRTNVANELSTEQNLVSLTAASPVTGSFTVTVSGVKDSVGLAMSTTNVPGTLINLTSTSVGSPAGTNAAGAKWGPDPQFPATITQWGPGNYDVLCNGNDYWNNADGMNFLWEPKTNSFDVKVRVVSVSPINNWSAGALEVRDGPVTTNGGGWELARHYFIKTDYSGPDNCLDGSGTGAKAYEYNCRTAPGDPTVRETANSGPGQSRGTWNDTAIAGAANGVPAFPNAWIRIARVRNSDGSSDHLNGYSSADGLNWVHFLDTDLNDANHAGFQTLGGTNAGPWPSVCYVGLASVSHTGFGNNNATNSGAVGEFNYAPSGQPYGCYVIYRDYGDFTSSATPTGPTVAITHNTDGTVTLTYTGNLYSAPTVNGTYIKVPTATSPFKVTPTPGQATTFYRAGP